ncbi:DUF3152 domain-containing protein [Longispora albida]|uniref:DUF3152 domain-containing protein n=1 Tax=Longispora albida TaxID=203523 RepID=UPI000A079201|nr:DUF3152 domain-containing protein [Longispora albida]
MTTTSTRPRTPSARSLRRARVQRRHRQTRITASVILALAAVIAAAALARKATFDPEPGQPVSSRPAPAAAPPRATPASPEAAASKPAATQPAPVPITYPRQGPATYTVIGGQSAILGTSGQLLRFRVSIENGITGLDPAAVASFIETTYADPRGWTAGGQYRFQRVGDNQPHEYTIYLATPATRAKLCADGNDTYTSCRNANNVVLNIARWTEGVPHFKDPIEAYRQYALNHETGHRLGHGHETCPGDGRTAPVMQQQTLGMHGCTPGAWPYQDGKRYTGPPGQYNDPIPG